MKALPFVRRWKSIFRLENTIGLFILLISSMSVVLAVWHLYFQPAEADFGPTLQDEWSPVNGLNDTYAFNAYYTGRDNLVRIVGVGPTLEKPNIKCVFHHKRGVKNENENRVLGTLVQMLDAHKKRHNNIEIVCPLQSGAPPFAVSVSSLEASSDYYLKINYPPNNKVKFIFSVCTPALHSNYSELKEIVQSVELDRLFGAEKFTFYYQSTSPEVDAVLRMYSDLGVMKVVPWKVPNVDVHYFAQMASVRDCFYRNMHTSHFIAFKDLDEVLLPYKHSNWKGLIDELLLTDPSAGAFIFRNSFIHKLGPDVTESINKDVVGMAKTFGLYAILKQFRQTVIWEYKLRAKFIVNPLRVNNVMIHQVRDLRKGFNLVVVNETLGLMFHYRKTVDRKIPTAKDPGMRPFKDILIDRVDYIYFLLNKDYTIWKPLFQ